MHNISQTHLSEEGDGFLAHSMAVTDVGFNDLRECFFYSLH